MPNGDRVPFRVPDWFGPALASPTHSTDSDINPLRFRVLARWVLVRWREYVRRRKAQGSMSRSSTETHVPGSWGSLGSPESAQQNDSPTHSDLVTMDQAERESRFFGVEDLVDSDGSWQ